MRISAFRFSMCFKTCRSPVKLLPYSNALNIRHVLIFILERNLYNVDLLSCLRQLFIYHHVHYLSFQVHVALVTPSSIFLVYRIIFDKSNGCESAYLGSPGRFGCRLRAFINIKVHRSSALIFQIK